MWKVVASGEDERNDVGFVVEENQETKNEYGTPAYRFRFHRTKPDTTGDYDDTWFDPLNGELDAIQELCMHAIQPRVSNRAEEVGLSRAEKLKVVRKRRSD